MKDRIFHLMTAEGLTPIQLADKLDVQRSGISHLLAGRNKPGFDFIEKVLRAFPELNPRWFILGEGEPYEQSSTPQPAATQAELPYDLPYTAPAPEVEKKQAAPALPTQAPQATSVAPVAIEQIVNFYADGTFRRYVSQ
ncbi:transcriptional regulator [Bacteroidia bacterium]|nr:transcriptional regulator [Bacteroidia bacterium]